MGNSASKGAQASGKAVSRAGAGKKRQYPAANNPAIAIVNARDRIARRFAEESEDLGRKAFAGRTLLSAREIREVISAKEQRRWGDSAIEKQFHLKSGVLAEILSGGAVKNV
ncbi:hypothetical protein DV736_g4796, partial [Chaetothyriales sp. CBS 134916]